MKLSALQPGRLYIDAEGRKRVKMLQTIPDPGSGTPRYCVVDLSDGGGAICLDCDVTELPLDGAPVALTPMSLLAVEIVSKFTDFTGFDVVLKHVVETGKVDTAIDDHGGKVAESFYDPIETLYAFANWILATLASYEGK
jgi:hypothetical protein